MTAIWFVIFINLSSYSLMPATSSALFPFSFDLSFHPSSPCLSLQLEDDALDLVLFSGGAPSSPVLQCSLFLVIFNNAAMLVYKWFAFGPLHLLVPLLRSSVLQHSKTKKTKYENHTVINGGTTWRHVLHFLQTKIGMVTFPLSFQISH